MNAIVAVERPHGWVVVARPGPQRDVIIGQAMSQERAAEFGAKLAETASLPFLIERLTPTPAQRLEQIATEIAALKQEQVGLVRQSRVAPNEETN